MSGKMSLGSLASAGVLDFGDGYRTKRSEHGTPGYRILRVADVGEGTLSADGPDFVSVGYTDKINSKLSEPGDVLLTTKGTVGRVAIVPEGQEPLVYSPQLCYFRVREPNRLNARYLSYWFRSRDFLRQAAHRANNTDMAAYINLADIRSLELRLPHIDEQRAIVEVLGALDDKIAANRALLETLNELPDVLFRQLTHSVADSVPLLEVADVVKGVSYRSAGLVDDSDTALVTLKSVSRDGRFVARGFKPYSGEFRTAQEVHVGDTIVAQTDLTQGAEVVGWAVRVPDVHDYATLVATLDLAIVRPKDECPSEFILGALRQPQFRNHCRAMVSGTTVLHLAKGAFPSYGVPKVEHAAARQYAEEVRGLHRLGDAIARESERLTNTRDALLPLLMSGKVTVKDAESVVEGVA